jgi:hypothetical protein
VMLLLLLLLLFLLHCHEVTLSAPCFAWLVCCAIFACYLLVSCKLCPLLRPAALLLKCVAARAELTAHSACKHNNNSAQPFATYVPILRTMS